MERWLPVVGYEGLYEVSDLGRLRSLGRTYTAQGRWGVRSVTCRPKPMRSAPNSNGYPRVSLSNANGESTRHYVHALVCEAFHGARPSPRHEVAHADGTRTNNSAANLRWASREENAQDTVAHGRSLRGERNPFNKYGEEMARAIRRQPHRRRCDLARELGVSPTTVHDVRTGKSWGYLWQ